MSERYSRLYTLPENQYATGSPILISAGALLKDNLTGQIIVQLKFKNICSKQIKAVKVCINAFDVTGVPLQGVEEYQYLDLSARRDETFGQKSAIFLPDRVARSFSCACKNVLFEDGTLWEANTSDWSQLAVPSTLDFSLGDLSSQYRRDTNKGSKYVVTDDRDLWHCTCGAINHQSEGNCHSCRQNKQILLDALVLPTLQAHNAAFLAEEAAKAAALEREQAEAREKKKKIAKWTALTASAIVAVAAAVFLITNVVIPNIKYNAAVDLMTTEQYVEAIAAFEAMDGYKDSVANITECKYNHATVLMNEGNYTEAIYVFQNIEKYKDSKDKIFECRYNIAITHMEAKEFAQAEAILSSLDGYASSNSKLAVIYAVDSIASNDFDTAIKTVLSASEAIHVKYNLNGGSSSEGDSFAYSSPTEYASLLVPQNEGYRFVGWTLSDYSYSKDHSLALVLDAVWSDTYLITYELAGGKAENPSEYSKTGEAITLTNPTKEGYTFDGWTGTDLTELTTDVTIPAGSYGLREYTANWTPNTYKIIYNLSGGTNSSENPRTFTVESPKITLKNPSKKGYKFVGWYSDSSYKNKITEINAGSLSDINLYAKWETDGSSMPSLGPTINTKIQVTSLSAGYYHSVGLHSDGTVVAVGDNRYGQCNTSKWSNIVAVAAGNLHTVGLRSDGTVVAVGQNDDSECNVSEWSNIIAIDASNSCTIGLRSDGTVVAVGWKKYNSCDVSDWNNIVAVATGNQHTLGVRSDGTVVAVGQNDDGQCNVSGWSNIVAVAGGHKHTVGLRSDGTVVAVGDNSDGQCNVSGWNNIVAIAVGKYHTVGLRSDGTVVATGDNSENSCDVYGWNDIVAISANYGHTLGLRSDGTVLSTGFNSKGQCNVSGWRNIKLPEK